MKTTLTEQLNKKAKSLSFDLFGVADPMCFELQRAPEGHKPEDYLSSVRSVIILGMKVIDSILQTAPSGIYSKHYDAINELLSSGAYQLAKWLEDKGYRSLNFPGTNDEIIWEQYNVGYTVFVPCFNHMAVAVAAGLGKRGACGVVLTPQYGPRQRWISMITEAPLDFGKEMAEEICLEKRKANSCVKCAEACPIQAISLDGGTDVRRCWIHWTGLREKDLACGVCIKACPVGRKKGKLPH